MTEQEFLALEPREQDALVAEKVMGYEDDRQFPLIAWVGLPSYTSQIAPAWEAVEKMGEHPDATLRTLHMVVYPYGRTYATFDGALDSEDWTEANGEGHTPLAICLAALKAKGAIE